MKPESTHSSAVLRLARSRDALRQAMPSNPASDFDAASQGTPTASSAAPTWLDGLRLLQSKPGGHLIIQTLQQIWAKNSWHLLGQSAYQAADIALKPIAQRSPIKLVAGAFVVGASLLWARPWRLMPKGALLSALWPD